MILNDLFKKVSGGSSRVLGVDVGTTSIKAAEIIQGGQRARLENYAFLETTGHLLRANKVLQTSSLKLFESEAAELLKEIVRNMKPGTRDVVASLPSFAAFITVLDLPEMQPNEMAEAIKFQARQFVPLPMSEVANDWIKVREYTDNQGYKHNQTLLISVPNEQIRKYQKMFQFAGLNLRALEVESFSLVRSAIGADPTVTVLIDIGSHSTNICVAAQGILMYNSQVDYASAALTQALASSLNINPIRAEELKKERGIVGSGANYELSTVLFPPLDVIISEVKKVLFNYQTTFPQAAQPERVLMAGGGANLPGLDKYFQQELNLPTNKVAPFSRLDYPPQLEPLVPELNSILAVALGLGLHEPGQ